MPTLRSCPEELAGLFSERQKRRSTDGVEASLNGGYDMFLHMVYPDTVPCPVCGETKLEYIGAGHRDANPETKRTVLPGFDVYHCTACGQFYLHRTAMSGVKRKLRICGLELVDQARDFDGDLIPGRYIPRRGALIDHACRQGIE